MSKTSASVSSGVPNTEKHCYCFEVMKHEARVFDMTSQSRLKIQCNKACKNSRLKIQCNKACKNSRLKIQCYKACKNNVFPAGMVDSSCKSLPVFREPFVPC